MSTPSEESLNANGGSVSMSHGTDERHPAESDNVISLALRADGLACASVERHPIENNLDPIQSPCAPLQPAVEGDLAISEDVAHRTSEGLRERLERGAIDTHEPSLLSHDATDSGRQELERLEASVRVERPAVENDHDPLQSPKKESAQPAVEGDFAISEDAALLASEGLLERLERRAVAVPESSLCSRDANGDQQELDRLAANVRAV